MSQSAAEIVREYGPFPGVDQVHGVTYDGQHVWFAAGDRLNAFDPATGKTLRSIDIAANAGTAFDGRHLYQLAGDRIQKIDPKTGRVLATIPAPGGGNDSGLTWAEGTLWVGQYRDRKIYQSIPRQGRFFARSSPIASLPGSPGSTESCGTAPGKATRVICGESIRERERFWRGSRCRPEWPFRGLESDGGELFFCGGGNSGKVRAVRAQRRSATGSSSEIPVDSTRKRTSSSKKNN